MRTYLLPINPKRMVLTSDQLDHLAMLCRLELTADEKKKLLPHLEEILQFVWKLDECDVDDIPPLSHPQDDKTLQTWSGDEEERTTSEELLQNIDHPIDNQAIGVKPPH